MMHDVLLNQIILEKTAVGTKVAYYFDAPAEFRRFLKEDCLFVEYPADISGCPDAVLAIPFVGIMSTVTMILHTGISVPSCDRTFIDSLRSMEGIFQSLYRSKEICISVKAAEMPYNTYTPSGKPSVFFTGGVDATSAFVAMAEKRPQLINIQGGDVRLDDDASHAALETYFSEFARAAGTSFCFIRTNAREMFEEDALGGVCEKILGHRNNHGWWASIAHILSMTSAIAPWMWVNRISDHYIGSSYDAKLKTFDANNEKLIEALRYCSCTFHTVDNHIERNEKVRKIIEYSNATGTNVQLKVCWNRTAGCNCSACEKCYRTMMNVMINRADPNRFGFNVDRNTLAQMREFLSSRTVSAAFWNAIQHSFREDAAFWRGTELAWMLDIKINSLRAYTNRAKQIIGRKLGFHI